MAVLFRYILDTSQTIYRMRALEALVARWRLPNPNADAVDEETWLAVDKSSWYASYEGSWCPVQLDVEDATEEEMGFFVRVHERAAHDLIQLPPLGIKGYRPEVLDLFVPGPTPAHYGDY